MIKLKRNKKGFTLIELLATVAIIGVIMAISIVGVTTYISKSEEKATLITKTNVLSISQKYVKEYYNDSDWMTDTYSNEYTKEISCVSISQLKQVGYIDKKVNDEGIEFIILKRNKNTKVIESKKFAREEDEKTCGIYFVINPEIINEKIDNPTIDNTKIYTNRIIARFKISATNAVREIKNINVQYKEADDEEYITHNSVDLSNDITAYGTDELFSILKIDLNNLKHNTNYEFKVTVEYKINGDEDNIKSIESLPTILKTKKLTSPTINVTNENAIRKEKNISIEYKLDDIDNSNENAKTYFGYAKYKNVDITTLGEYEYLDDFSSISSIYNEDEYKKNDIYINKELTSQNNLIVKSNETRVIASITDGTNTVKSEKMVKNIDSNDYTCSIDKTVSNDNTILTLKINGKDESDDIVDKINWNYSNSPLNNENNKSITIKNYGLYSANVILRTEEEIECGLHVFPENNDLKIEVKRLNLETNLRETLTDFSKWYNGQIEVYLTSSYNISYCEEQGCTLEDKKTNAFTKTFSGDTSGMIYISAAVTGSTERQDLVLLIDNAKPSETGVEIKKIGNGETNTDETVPIGTNVTSDFKGSEGYIWKNYIVSLSNASSEDNHSGIDKYEYSYASLNADGEIIYGEPIQLNTNYNLTQMKKVIAFRAVDNAGNVGNWSDPYYFYIDLVNPTLSFKMEKIKDNNISDYSSNEGWVNSASVKVSLLDYGDNSNEIWSLKRKTYGATPADEPTYCYVVNRNFDINNCTFYISNEGITKVAYSIIDRAGNETYISDYIYLDRTPPKTFYLKTGAKKEGKKSDFFTEYKKNGNLYSFGQIKFGNFLNGYVDDNGESCALGKGNCNYEAFKCAEGDLDYSVDSCYDSTDGGETYDVVLNNSQKYIKWDLDDTYSYYEDTYGNTNILVEFLKNNKKNDLYKSVKQVNGKDSNLVQQKYYFDVMNHYGFTPLSFKDAYDGKFVTYQRMCIDEAGNESKLFTMEYEINTTEYQYASCDEDGCYSYDGCNNYTGYYCYYYDDGYCYDDSETILYDENGEFICYLDDYGNCY